MPGLRSVLVVLVVLLAGCSAGGGPTATQTPTMTAAPVPTAAQSTPRPVAEPTVTAMPPGVIRSGEIDSVTLAYVHGSQLPGSYTVTERYRISRRDGSAGATHQVTVTVASPDRYLATSRVEGTTTQLLGRPDGTVETYANGTAVVRRVTADGRTTRGVVRGPDGEVVQPRAVPHGTPHNDARIALLFGELANVSVTAGPERGTYRLTATALATDSITVDDVQLSNVTLARFTAVVTRDGLVREYRLTLHGMHDGHRVTAVEHVRYSGLGTTTVERPSWLRRATETSSPQPG